MIRFKSSADLVRFYEDDKHSEIRHAIYKLLSEHTIGIVLGDLKLYPTSELRKAVFETAEAKASEYLSRFDFVNGDQIEDIIARQPYHW
jgi:hypothetical protein